MERVRKSDLINRRGEITETGMLFNELVRHDLYIVDADDPEIMFAMSPEYRGKIETRRDELVAGLELPENREVIMEKGKQILLKAGHPYWRVGNEGRK